MPFDPTVVRRYDRREFLRRGTRRSLGVALGVTAGPTLLAACAGSDPAATGPSPAATPTATAAPTPTQAPPTTEAAEPQGTPIIGDVIDFALSSDEWEGAFGFVTLALHRALVAGNDVYFIRTDTSDADYAEQQQLVHVPKLAPLTGEGLSHRMVVFEDADDQPPVLEVEPGMTGYSPAWRLSRARFTGEPVELGSLDDVDQAVSDGAVELDETDIIVNAAIIQWSDGHMPVDTELTDYLGGGQLIEPPDTDNLRVTMKLNQCYPSTWYIVTDHSLPGPAQNTNTVLSDGLQEGPSEAGATGRTNVFMNGIPGPGPMGFQPSAFDFPAGDPEWSPYWDHFAYRWRDDATPRVLTTQTEVHEARDAGELEEFPGVPPTEGVVFTVNCPSPVLAPVTFEPPDA